MLKILLKRLPALLLLGLCLVFAYSLLDGPGADFAPEALILTPGGVETELNLAWQNKRAEGELALLRLRNETDGSLSEWSGSVGSGAWGQFFHKVSLRGLSPGASYSYTLSSDGKRWSRQYAYRAPLPGPFRFALVGDPQLNGRGQDQSSAWFSADKSTAAGWQAVMDKIAVAGGGVAFIAGVGDQVNSRTGNKREYADFAAPLQGIPFAPALGNHDRNYFFQYYFHLSNERRFAPILAPYNKKRLREGVAEAAGNYWYKYNQALFVVLNNSAYPDSAAAALPYIQRFEETLAAAVAAHKGQYIWLFAQYHKPTRSGGAHARDKDVSSFAEAGLEELMDKYGVDFVLTGHDHLYARSFALKAGQTADTGLERIARGKGVIYITATCAGGGKYYSEGPAEDYLAVRLQNRKPGYAIIDVEEEAVHFKAYSVDSDIPVDAFTVVRAD